MESPSKKTGPDDQAFTAWFLEWSEKNPGPLTPELKRKLIAESAKFSLPRPADDELATFGEEA